MDMHIQTADYINILEFKLDHSAEDALRQIDDRQYAMSLEHDGRHIYNEEVSFSPSPPAG